jgi:hypothetical protein
MQRAVSREGVIQQVSGKGKFLTLRSAFEDWSEKIGLWR